MRDLSGKNLETWCEVDLTRFRKNIEAIRSVVGQREIILAVKANAYGHGVVHIAREGERIGIHYFGVATVAEGIALREAGIESNILLLTPATLDQIEEILNYDLIPNVVSRRFAEGISQAAQKMGKVATCQIEVDTGMGRTGFLYEEVIGELIAIMRLPNLKVSGIFSHFPSADSNDPEDIDYTYTQINRFHKIVQTLKKLGLEIPLYHISNSAGILNYPVYGNAIRPGILAYGLYPSSWCQKKIPVEPILSFRTKVIQIRAFPAGFSVSYGRTYQTEKPSLLGVIRAGYGDGLKRGLSNAGRVIIEGKFYPIVGRVCMDMSVVLLPPDNTVKLDSIATIIGEDNGKRITADEHAEILGTINYEIITGLSERVPRLYFRDGSLVGQNDLEGVKTAVPIK